MKVGRVAPNAPRCASACLLALALPVAASASAWSSARPAENLTIPAEAPLSAKTKLRPILNRIQVSPTDALGLPFSFLTGFTFSSHSAFTSLPATAASPPSTLLLDTFDASSATGSVIGTSTWSGQVTQNTSSITVAGTARNDNGWGATGLNLDASGLGFINLTAQRDPGHAASSLFLQFEDRATSTNTAIFSVDASLFALGSPTTLSIAVGNWGGADFDLTAIGGWSIGGGGVGTTDFRMTLHNLELSATAIPEPSTYAALAGLAALVFTLHRRRRR